MKKILLGLLLIILCGCNAVISDNSSTRSEYDLSFKDKDLDYSYSLAEAHYIELGDEDLYINNEGTYVLTGEMNDASVIVNVKDDEKVKLVLDNVTINSNDFASIYIVESDKVTITLAEDSVNTLSDSSAYSQVDDQNVDAVIYSKADLVINGTGKLIVNGNVAHGIVSKDDLIITGGNLDVTSIKQGIRGKDCIKIKDSTLNITSGGDSIKSDNEDDEYRGFVYIAGGSINMDSGDDTIGGYRNPQILDELVEACGCETIGFYDFKRTTCGSGFRQRYANKDLSMDVTKDKLQSLKADNVDILVHLCPNCHVQFDRYQNYIDDDCKTIHLNIAQFIAIAMGADFFIFFYCF